MAADMREELRRLAGEMTLRQIEDDRPGPWAKQAAWAKRLRQLADRADHSEGARGMVTDERVERLAKHLCREEWKDRCPTIEQMTAQHDSCPPLPRRSTCNADRRPRPATEAYPRRHEAMTLYVEQICLIPVSKACSVGLYATGPYGRKQIESLIGMLQLQVDIGCYDADTPDQPAPADDHVREPSHDPPHRREHR